MQILQIPGRISNWLWRVVEKSDFPRVESFEAEQAKIDILRIVTGLILTYRTYMVYVVTSSYFHEVFYQRCAAAGLLLSVMLLLGIATPFATAALVIFYNYMDVSLATKTLGTNILSVLLIVLFLANAGGRYSFDSLLLNARQLPWLQRLMNVLYRSTAFPDRKQLTVVYWLGFCAYGLLSLAAITLHVQDTYWVQGYTSQVMVSSSYLSQHYQFFREMEESVPWLTRFLSICSSAGQSIFQVFMIPLMFWRWGRYFVVIWGLIFFAVSTFVLQLSYLPYIEIVLWALVFYRPQAKTLAMFFTRLRGSGNAMAKNETSGVEIESAFIKSILISAWFFILAFFVFKIAAETLKVNYERLSGRAYKYSNTVLYWSGMEVPNVFNRTDLAMGDRWRVIYRRPVAETQRQMIPLCGMDGERLKYLSHDVLYFGNDLHYRRNLIDFDVKLFNQPTGFGYSFTKKVVEFDYKYTQQKDTVIYTVEVYKNQSSDVNVPVSERYKPVMIDSHEIVVLNGKVVNR